MLAPERLLEIEEKFGTKVERIVPVEFDEDKYLGQPGNLQPSKETSLDEVMGAILKMK